MAGPSGAGGVLDRAELEGISPNNLRAQVSMVRSKTWLIEGQRDNVPFSELEIISLVHVKPEYTVDRE